ncbi:HhoA/HhoB/HtrA family serine endopeptidase [Leptodesmis sp.]|uniref:HhoA/HhoB/HtrA family serine endopeptidase n=1 Tax=Leptodesmis sp. TaxID=3100501 RepID=UPI0040535228
MAIHLSWKQPISYIAIAALGAGVAITGDRLLTPPASIAQAPTSSQTTAAKPNPQPAPVNSQTPTNFITAAVDKVGPAVVRIDSTQKVQSFLPEGFDDPMFRQFFGGKIPSSQEVRRGVGSGFIIDGDGKILTNAHVVAGSDTVKVTLTDGRSFTGKVLGADSVTDVAVIKIDANNLPAVPLGNSDQLKPGEWAIAIGNPLGLDNTVTEGIISATGRSSNNVGVPAERVNFIQTDAAINPGNSGGPLLNAQGKVIGMNTAIIQNAQGIGFAIPINTAKNIADQLIAKGKVEHAYLGIQMVNLSPELKKQINQDPNSNITVQQDQGVLIAKVMPDSPAAKAGLKSGDVIDKINNQTMKDSSAIQQLVEQTPVGNELQIGVTRNGQPMTLPVRVGTLPRQDS